MRAFAILAVGCACVGGVNQACAQTVTVLEDLDFGRLLTVDDSAGFLTVAPDGDITTSANVIVLMTGRPAEFFVEGAVPSQQLQIDVVATTYLAGQSQPLTKPTVNNVVVEPVTVIANTSGEASFSIGATVNTNGRTPTGLQEEYVGVLTVTVTQL